MSQSKRTHQRVLARHILIAGLLFASTFTTFANGQQTLQGQVTSDGSQTDFYNVYANSDPLDGQPEVTPTTIGPNSSNKCVPLSSNWKIVAQVENTCYWYVPFSKPLNDYVVPMAKMSWVESTGGTCGVNPFSDPDNPNGTAICDQPAPQNDPYAPSPQTAGGPSSPPTDYYSINPYDPTRLLTAYREIIDVATHGSPQQISLQIGAQLQQDMTSCSKYAAKGILSSRCCTNLGQAANNNMLGTQQSRAEAKMYVADATTTCVYQPRQAPPSNASSNTHFYTVADDGDPQKLNEVLAGNPRCQQWSSTQVICQDPGREPPIVLRQEVPTSADSNGNPVPRHPRPTKTAQNNPPDLLAPPMKGTYASATPPLHGVAKNNQPKEPSTVMNSGAQVGKKLGCVKVRVGNQHQRFNVTSLTTRMVGDSDWQKVTLLQGEIPYFGFAISTRYADGSDYVTEVKHDAFSTAYPVHVLIEFNGPCPGKPKR